MLKDQVLASYYLAFSSQNYDQEVEENLDQAHDDWRIEKIICVKSYNKCDGLDLKNEDFSPPPRPRMWKVLKQRQ